MPQDNQSQLPDKFQGWDRLAIHEGEAVPPGWTNMVSADKPQAPGQALPVKDVSASEPNMQTMISDAGETVRIAASKVQHAINSGLHKAVEMVHVPTGVSGWVPEHRVSDALASKEFRHVNQ